MGTIPPNIDEVLQELKKEIIWIHGRWIVYRQLFGTSEQRVNLLNECASTFFVMIDDVLFNEIKISLSKLTDPERIGVFDNLSLEQLQARVEAEDEQILAQELRALLDDLQQKCEPFREWRNKRLAHLDLTVAVQNKTRTLPGVSRQMIEEALLVVRNYMNEIELHYCDTQTAYEHFILTDDGEALVAMLKYGLRYKDLVKERQIPLHDWWEGGWKDA